MSLSLASGASYIARTAAVNPRQAKEILVEAIRHDGFAHVDFLTQCPTWNKDAKEYVPYTDVQDDDEFDFDVTDRREAAEAMYDAESRLYEGEVLTGRFYRQRNRLPYDEEKQATGEMPSEPLAERYFDEDAEWERAADELISRHT
jgi:pyruvate ferredoxin oxidoreductase beta subunit